MLASADKGQANRIALRLFHGQLHRQLPGNGTEAVAPVDHRKGIVLPDHLRPGGRVREAQLQPFQIGGQTHHAMGVQSPQIGKQQILRHGLRAVLRQAIPPEKLSHICQKPAGCNNNFFNFPHRSLLHIYCFPASASRLRSLCTNQRETASAKRVMPISATQTGRVKNTETSPEHRIMPRRK